MYATIVRLWIFDTLNINNMFIFTQYNLIAIIFYFNLTSGDDAKILNVVPKHRCPDNECHLYLTNDRGKQIVKLEKVPWGCRPYPIELSFTTLL